jgi:hypothetical protein
MAPSAECQQNFPDDPEIQDTHQMLRRIPPWHVVPDGNVGGSRPSSAAFEDDDDGSPMSMYRRTVIEASGGNIDRVMVGHVGYGLAGINAGDLRSRDQTIHSDHLPAEPAHAVVCGPKTDSNRKHFYRRSVWVIRPPDV